MEFAQYAGVSTKRLDMLKNFDLTKKPYYNESKYTYNGGGLYEIIHNCADKKEKGDETYESFQNSKSDKKVAGLESEIINDINVGNRRSSHIMPSYRHDNQIKDILQNNVEPHTGNDRFSYLLSDRGNVLGPKKCLTKHIDDSEIGKYFSTKYAVTDKNSGRTEIMVQRKAGCSNVIVQNFSAFDAYATFRNENKRKERPDSVTHTTMGIVPKPGYELTEKRNKGIAVFSNALRTDHIAPSKYWMCPTAESEHKRR